MLPYERKIAQLGRALIMMSGVAGSNPVLFLLFWRVYEQRETEERICRVEV